MMANVALQGWRKQFIEKLSKWGEVLESGGPGETQPLRAVPWGRAGMQLLAGACAVWEYLALPAH